MNDFDLESKLKSIKVPARAGEYWEGFPSHVRSQLRRPVFVERAQTRFVPQWGWNSGLAVACVVMFFSLLPAFHAVLKDERALQQDAKKFPRQLHLLMADEHGMQYLVTDRD